MIALSDTGASPDRGGVDKMQILLTQAGNKIEATLVDAPALDGTERQATAAHGIRKGMIEAVADFFWASGKSVELVQKAMDAQATKLAAITAKQWLDANDKWDTSKRGQSAVALVSAMIRGA